MLLLPVSVLPSFIGRLSRCLSALTIYCLSMAKGQSVSCVCVCVCVPRTKIANFQQHWFHQIAFLTHWLFTKIKCHCDIIHWSDNACFKAWSLFYNQLFYVSMLSCGRQDKWTVTFFLKTIRPQIFMLSMENKLVSQLPPLQLQSSWGDLLSCETFLGAILWQIEELRKRACYKWREEVSKPGSVGIILQTASRGKKEELGTVIKDSFHPHPQRWIVAWKLGHERYGLLGVVHLSCCWCCWGCAPCRSHSRAECQPVFLITNLVHSNSVFDEVSFS